MNANRKEARNFLKTATRAEYTKAVYEAKLTPEQEDVLGRHILKDETLVQISFALHCTVARVKAQLTASYNSIYKVIIKGTPK